jgi:hypothetical protein
VRRTLRACSPAFAGHVVEFDEAQRFCVDQGNRLIGLGKDAAEQFLALGQRQLHAVLLGDVAEAPDAAVVPSPESARV